MSETKPSSGLSPGDRDALWRHMREPLMTFAGLALLLTVNIAFGWFQPFRNAWMVELPIMGLMIAIVLLFSMEVLEEPGLVRFFSVLGFCWVAILFMMTMIDYATR